jgi:YVTN family beta-propeller protein
LVLIYPEVEEVTVKPTVLKLDRGPHKLKIDPISNRIYIANKNSNSILVLDGQSDQLIKRIKIEAPRDLILDSESQRMYVLSNYKIVVLETATYQPINGVDPIITESVGNMTMNKNRDFIYLTNDFHESVDVVDVDNGELTKEIKTGSKPEGITTNVARNKIYVANSGSGSISIIDGSLNKVVNTIDFKESTRWERFMSPRHPKKLVYEPSTGYLYVLFTAYGPIGYDTPGTTPIKVVNGSSDLPLTDSQIETTITDLCVNTSNNIVYCIDKYYGRIDAYDTLVAKRFKTTPISKHARNISVNPVTNKLYVTVNGIFTNSLFVLEF